LLTVAAACSFSPHAAHSDGPARAIDAAVIVDAPSDGSGSGGSGSDGSDGSAGSGGSAVTDVCQMTAASAPQTRGQLGSTDGGSTGPNLICPAGELPVGFAFDTSSKAPPEWSQQAVGVTHVRCATIAARSDGTVHATPDATLLEVTTGPCNDWPPFVPGGELDCPDGSVVVAMSGNEAHAGGTRSLFDTVAMTCAVLDLTGAPTAVTSQVVFADTAHNTDRPEAPACGAGEVVVQLATRTGCAQDALALQCAKLSCPSR
jgi:hypothetical protein